jgi:hypothetical protein
METQVVQRELTTTRVVVVAAAPHKQAVLARVPAQMEPVGMAAKELSIHFVPIRPLCTDLAAAVRAIRFKVSAERMLAKGAEQMRVGRAAPTAQMKPVAVAVADG